MYVPVRHCAFMTFIAYIRQWAHQVSLTTLDNVKLFDYIARWC
jgi:hypothetical protein